jgi:hypothetical protein
MNTLMHDHAPEHTDQDSGGYLSGGSLPGQRGEEHDHPGRLSKVGAARGIYASAGKTICALSVVILAVRCGW